MATKTFPYASLSFADLVIDAIYEGGNSGNASDDPISRLVDGAGNQGGFRSIGQGLTKRLIVLYTSGENKDWPDTLDVNTGQLIYYGDNRSPGHALHSTPKRGNMILAHVYELLHSSSRRTIPPFLIFQKFPTSASKRSVQFKGLAAPGFPGVPATEDLVAIWKSTEGHRFQNYRAVFTILDVASITRASLSQYLHGDNEGLTQVWSTWITTGRYKPLTAKPTVVIRTVEQQTANTDIRRAIVRRVWERYHKSPVEFEAFAAKLYQMSDRRVIIDLITRASADGGRDAIGRYLLGLPDDPVYVEFALEAKCYRPPNIGGPSNTVGVKEISRLISRLRHRQFGVLVTTSVIARQAYEEVRADAHPIIFIAGRDIAEILIANGYNSIGKVDELLGACGES